MSLRPAFVSGANAKLAIADTNYILAFASDVNFTVDVTVVPIEAIGKIQIISYEPVAYSVAGSMNVMRYTGKQMRTAGLAGTLTTADTTYSNVNVGNAANDIAQNYAKFGAHFDPEAYMASETFDLIVFVKSTELAGSAATTSWDQLYTIKNCRLTRRGNALTKRGVMVDAYSFVATEIQERGVASIA